jgi:hypothetical protein
MGEPMSTLFLGITGLELKVCRPLEKIFKRPARLAEGLLVLLVVIVGFDEARIELENFFVIPVVVEANHPGGFRNCDVFHVI